MLALFGIVLKTRRPFWEAKLTCTAGAPLQCWQRGAVDAGAAGVAGGGGGSVGAEVCTSVTRPMLSSYVRRAASSWRSCQASLSTARFSGEYVTEALRR